MSASQSDLREQLPEPTRRRFEVEPGRFLVADEWTPGPELASQTPVLFLHGGGQTRHAWGGAAAALAARGWHTLSMDHRGHGESDWHPEGDYSFIGFAEDLERVLAQLPARPVLVGASLGGICSLMVETRLERSVCEAMVLVDITPRVNHGGIRRILDFMAHKPDGFESLEEVADHIASYLPHRKRKKDLSGLEKNLRRTPDGRYRWHWDPAMMTSWDVKPDPDAVRKVVEERLSRARTLTVPVLLVRGRMSDVVSEENAREFLEVVPHAEYLDLEGAAHMVAGDRNDAFADAVIDFVERKVGRAPTS